MTKPTIIFTTSIMEYPPLGGPRLRTANTIKALSQVADLIIYSRTSLKRLGGDDSLAYFKKFAKEFVFSPSVSGRGSRFSYLSLFRDFRGLVVLAKKNNIKIVWLGFGNISYGLALLLKLFTPLQVVMETDSVWSRFVLRGIPYEKTLAGKIKRIWRGYKKRLQEYVGTKICNVTTAVSEVDAEYYKKFIRHSNTRRVAIFSNFLDLGSYQNLKPENLKKPAICLTGSIGPNSPMEEGALWFIEKVLPLIWKVKPETYFYLIGKTPTEKLLKLQNDRIKIFGPVISILPYLASADVAVVPLHFESGTRSKILEASAMKKAIVSTTLGAEGLEIQNGKNIIIADDPVEFAKATLNLLENEDLRRTLGENAEKDIAAKFDINKAVSEANIVLDILNLNKK